MAEYIKREAAIAYIREQSEECQKAFEELGGDVTENFLPGEVRAV